MSDDDELYVQAATEGEDTLADFVGREAKHFTAHLDGKEAETGVTWAAANRIHKQAGLFKAISTAVYWATTLGIVEGVHLIVKYW
jgi:hypothetical protein